MYKTLSYNPILTEQILIEKERSRLKYMSRKIQQEKMTSALVNYSSSLANYNS